MSEQTDAEKRLAFTPTEDQLYTALQQLINGEHSLYIPPLPEDADIVIGNMIREWKDLQRQVSELTEERDDYRSVLSSTLFDIATNNVSVAKNVIESILAKHAPRQENINDQTKHR